MIQKVLCFFGFHQIGKRGLGDVINGVWIEHTVCPVCKKRYPIKKEK